MVQGPEVPGNTKHFIWTGRSNIIYLISLFEKSLLDTNELFS